MGAHSVFTFASSLLFPPRWSNLRAGGLDLKLRILEESMIRLRTPLRVAGLLFVAACGSNAASTGGTGARDNTISASNDGSASSGETSASPSSSGNHSNASRSATGGTGGSAAAGLHAVMGANGRAGQIADENGTVVELRGADESGTENFCLTWGPPAVVMSPNDGPSPLDQASLTAMKKWGLNTVRIPLNEDCWLGINTVDSSVGGANYQTPIMDAVDLITQTNSMYVILDLHMSAPGTTVANNQGLMPDVDHSVTFWQQVAAAYKNNGSVIFDLFNEPDMGDSPSEDQQFSCWKNGSTTANGGDCPFMDFAVAGMQQLLTTVRQAGANNLVMLGGPGFSAHLELWPQYVPTDTLSPPNIAASWHVYDDQGGCTTDGATTFETLCDPSSGLGAQAVMNAGYPIVVGETGYYSCSGNIGQSWWPLFLSWADTQGIGYVAWSWSTANNPFLLNDVTSFTPGGIGPTYQTYLSCIQTKTVTPATSCTSIPKTGCENQ
jgi:hypothetical protein